jgi:hypothetical protein
MPAHPAWQFEMKRYLTFFENFDKMNHSVCRSKQYFEEGGSVLSCLIIVFLRSTMERREIV